MASWQSYLQSFCQHYRHWQSFIPLGLTEPLPFIKERLIQADRISSSKIDDAPQDAFTWLRQQSSQTIGLQAPLGSGLSTLLERLAFQIAQELSLKLEDACPGSAWSKHWKVPVLIELSRYETSCAELILATLQQFDPSLTPEDLEGALKNGQLWLIWDGCEQLVTQSARQDCSQWVRQHHRQNGFMLAGLESLPLRLPLPIFRLHPLSAPQISTLDARIVLQDTLLPWQRSPFLLTLNSALSSLPTSWAGAGPLCQAYAQQCDRQFQKQLKSSLPNGWEGIFPELAYQLFIGMDGQPQWQLPKPIFLALVKDWLNRMSSPIEPVAETCAEQLITHPLLVCEREQIAFVHPYFREHFAAVWLMQQLPMLTGETLLKNYLNQKSWTEPIRIGLSLLTDKQQVLRLVRLALSLDWFLGARLIGVVAPKWQPEALACLLHKPMISERLKIKLLQDSGSREAVPELQAATQGDDPSARQAALVALSTISPAAAADVLPRGLMDPQEIVRATAADCWGNLRLPDPHKILLNALQDECPTVRRAAAFALGKLPIPEALPSLTRRLSSETDLSVREAITQALGNLGSLDALTALSAVAQASPPSLAMVALRSLNRLSRPATVRSVQGILSTLNWSLSSSHWLTQVVERSILIAAWQKELTLTEDETVQEQIIQSLGQWRAAEAVPALITLLNDGKSSLRNAILTSIGNIATPEAITTLIELLQKPGTPVRAKIAWALGLGHSERAVPPLIKALHDRSPEVRTQAATALARFPSFIAVPPLIAALDDADFDVRSRAAAILGHIGNDDAAIAALGRALYDADFMVRGRAAESLGYLQAKTAIPQLLDIYYDPEIYVRRRVMRSLGLMGATEAISILLQDLEQGDIFIRRWAAYELGLIRASDATPALISALGSSESELRLRAAEALGRIGDPAAVEPLHKCFEDAEGEVRLMALKARGKIRSTAGLPAILALVDDADPSIANQAVSVLGRLKTDEALPRLLEILANPPDFRHRKVIRALCRLGSPKTLPTLVNLLDQASSDDQQLEILGIMERIKTAQTKTKLVLRFASSSLTVREKIIAIFESWQSTSLQAELLKAAQDSSVPHQLQALRALARQKTSIANTILLNVLSAPNSEAKALAFEILAGSEPIGILLLVQKFGERQFIEANEGKTLELAYRLLVLWQDRLQRYQPEV
ncbi:MAG: HEAT repeat domain-containing protein [Cyanobacteria bacterium P01_H01_bin.15]